MEERYFLFVCGHPQSEKMPRLPPQKAFATICKVFHLYPPFPYSCELHKYMTPT